MDEIKEKESTVSSVDIFVLNILATFQSFSSDFRGYEIGTLTRSRLIQKQSFVFSMEI